MKLAIPVAHGHSAGNVPDEWVFSCKRSKREIFLSVNETKDFLIIIFFEMLGFVILCLFVIRRFERRFGDPFFKNFCSFLQKLFLTTRLT